MLKYRLVKDSFGNRAAIINKTSEVITEALQPLRYKELRAKAIKNITACQKNEILKDICGTSARQAKIDMGL